jgi:hypothetical protein
VGYDAGAASLAAAPNAMAAAAAFDLAAGALPIVDYEGAVLPPGVGMSALNRTNNSGCPANLCGFNTTSGGSFFHLQVGGSQTFTFATPIDSFGAYFTGWQIGTQTITYSNNQQVVLQMPGADINQGGAVFFGFIDAGASIVSITYDAVKDIVAVDDVRFGNSAAVPEPASLLLLGAGLAGAASRLRRGRQ